MIGRYRKGESAGVCGSTQQMEVCGNMCGWLEGLEIHRNKETPVGMRWKRPRKCNVMQITPSTCAVR